MNGLLYSLRSGKNSKFLYFSKALLAECVPPAWDRHRLPALLDSIKRRPDRDEILRRAEYYCKTPSVASGDTPLKGGAQAPEGVQRFCIGDQKMPKKGQTYYFDSRSLLRFFPADFRVALRPGDITAVPDEPTLVKARPIAGGNANSVLLPLNKVRHFLFVDDRRPFASKRDGAVFRGKVHVNAKRRGLFRALFESPLCDLGDTSKNAENPVEWKTGKMTLQDQLAYKFVFAIEGNDVATNLKWVMSSNSLALMPRPEFETWFLEGTLVPDVHYVEIAPDYSDAEEKIRWYSEHEEAAEKILAAAHAHVARFRDPARERLTALLTLKRYFAGQMS